MNPGAVGKRAVRRTVRILCQKQNLRESAVRRLRLCAGPSAVCGWGRPRRCARGGCGKAPWTVRGPAMGNRAAARAGTGHSRPARRAAAGFEGRVRLVPGREEQEACGTRRRAGQGRAERVGVRDRGVRNRGGRNAEACRAETGGTRRRAGQGRAERGRGGPSMPRAQGRAVRRHCTPR